MCLRIARLVAAGAVHLLICVSSVHAQVDPKIENCLPYPSLAQDLRGRNAKIAPAPPQPKQKVVISEVKIEGGTQLPAAIQGELIASLKKKEFEADSKWVQDVENKVRGAWQDHGYFKQKADIQVQLVSLDSAQQKVALFVRVQEGLQYRLKEIRFRNTEDGEEASVFPLDQLRRLIPLEDGEIFNVAKIRDGLNALGRLYGTDGYIDFTAQPNTDVDEESGEIALTLDLDEQKQFHVGEIRVLGLEPVKEAALKWKLRSGDVFDNRLLDAFWSENKELLPADASPRDVDSYRDLRNGRLSLIFDFRRGCPTPEQMESDSEADKPRIRKRRP